METTAIPPLERAAIALSMADPDERGLPAGVDMAEFYRGLARAVLQAIREPSDAMLAVTVQQVGDPSSENWAAAERVCSVLGGPLVAGETAVAEVARDYQSMIDAALSE